jgi:hypothetical protein
MSLSADDAEMVTPEHAKHLLGRNVINRTIRWGWVKYLARQIRQGRWELLSDAIGIRKDGVLINGQHRLLAIIEAGVPAPLFIVRGLSEGAFMVTDRGKMRTLPDATNLPPTVIADTNLIAETLGWPRLAESEVQDVAAWWSPAYDELHAACGRTFATGFGSAAFRIGIGLRWALERRPDGRDYILRQYAAIVGNDTERMSKAGAALWKKWTREKCGGGGAMRRVQGIGIGYYHLDPDRAAHVPLMRHPDAVMEEVRAGLKCLEPMFLAAPPDAPHPYVPVDPAKAKPFRISPRGADGPDWRQAVIP